MPIQSPEQFAESLASLEAVISRPSTKSLDLGGLCDIYKQIKPYLNDILPWLDKIIPTLATVVRTLMQLADLACPG